ncbi:hypothetical protein ACJIZ3_009302 [Penstemon smallii]|uniref:Uncharacterized protein n=1 Tax=Penstemon smallii TaxID=265156 RepID=A0ABD3TD87_9LAMI
MPIIKFLNRFSSIQSLTFHLSFHNKPSGSFEPLVRWKFEKSEFIFLSAESVCVYSSEKGFENDEDDDDVLVEPSTRFNILISYHLVDAVWRYKNILKPIISDFPNLKNVSDADDVKFRLKRWDKNVVRLPLSGRVMKGVNVLVCKEIGINDGLTVSENGFEEEELCELASTMVKKDASYEGIISLTQILSLAARADVCVYSSEETFENADDDVLVEPFTHLKNLICYHLLDAVSRYEKILKPILCDFPNLKNISVTDSLNQGQIVLDEDDISSLRNEDEPIMEDGDGVNFSLQLWHENVVHLPISGRVMKDVGVVMCKKIGTDDCLMKSENGFEGEEFRELATTMVKKAARIEGVIPLALLIRLSRDDQE